MIYDFDLFSGFKRARNRNTKRGACTIFYTIRKRNIFIKGFVISLTSIEIYVP